MEFYNMQVRRHFMAVTCKCVQFHDCKCLCNFVEYVMTTEQIKGLATHDRHYITWHLLCCLSVMVWCGSTGYFVANTTYITQQQHGLFCLI